MLCLARSRVCGRCHLLCSLSRAVTFWSLPLSTQSRGGRSLRSSLSDSRDTGPGRSYLSGRSWSWSAEPFSYGLKGEDAERDAQGLDTFGQADSHSMCVTHRDRPEEYGDRVPCHLPGRL